MKTYYCKRCNFVSQKRHIIRKHLREEHLIGRRKISDKSDYFYSIDENGIRKDYVKKKY